ncbi:MAG: sugar phosphate isomerase/epimerase family protein [Gemmatimonadota bacterium]
MKLILFSKMLKEKSIEELAELAGRLGLDGYDLAVRPEYPVNPDNAARALPQAARILRAAGLDIPMLTGNFDLLEPSHPTAEPILGAMDAADVRLVKLGYFKLDPATMDYWAEVDRVRRIFEGWARLAEKHRVKVCYHTHSNRCMGLNAGMLAHLIRGLDPRFIGAYLDTGHLVAEGEEFAVAAAIVRPHLSIVSLKDFLLHRQEKGGHGSVQREVVEAGQGMVDWTAVFAELKRLGYRGPGTIHCEFEAADFPAAVAREVAFFRALRQASGMGG